MVPVRKHVLLLKRMFVENYLQPTDAISCIILTSGSFHETHWKRGPNAPFVLRRVVPPRVNIFNWPETEPKDKGALQPPRAAVPPKGNLTLHVSLTSVLSPPGSVGAVYATQCSIPDGNVDGLVLPPLVAKIAKPRKANDLIREAAMYEEMESLQGWGIPWCFGFFQFRSVEYFDFGPVSLLLLERCGECIPSPSPYVSATPPPMPPTVRHDLHEILSRVSKLGIYYMYRVGIDPKHVLTTAGASSSNNPSLQWRLVDFAFAKKTDLEINTIHNYHHQQISALCDDVWKRYDAAADEECPSSSQDHSCNICAQREGW
ncbi:hypothetical protein QCA50_005399 [Cerrena zonata]|uniref:Uncharacterized protein n=1 Tax=Cerrena zonata TaxID=2478898 RepID=A0AAW0GJP3_9APHY